MLNPDPDGQVNTEDYETVNDAVAAVPNKGTVVLSADTTMTTPIVVDGGKDVTINLNGNVLTSDGVSAIEVTDGTVTLVNGTIAAMGGDALNLDTRVSDGQIEVNIGEDVVLTTDTYSCIYVAGDAVVNVAGELSATSPYSAIQGNGNANSAGTIVNITGGTITATDVAIYLPQDGEVNISGGVITGDAAVYCKSGKLNITGGQLIANGAAREYEYNGNGCNSTGDALVIDSCNYPGGVPVVEVSGGQFVSANNKAVGSYNYGESELVTGFITGGTYSSDVSELCADGYKAIQIGSKWSIVKAA